MSEAWLRASETTASSSPSSASNTPPLASKQEPKRIDASNPKKRASRASSSRCRSCVPQMKRTEESPYPRASSARRAPSSTAGWEERPR